MKTATLGTGEHQVGAPIQAGLVHYAEVIALKGDSYRLEDRELGRVPAAINEED